LTGKKALEQSRKEMLEEKKKSFKFLAWPVLVWSDTLLQYAYYKLFKRNSIVILDRFPYDHYISFGFLGYLTRFTKWLYLHFPKPDETILLWVEPEIAYTRKKDTHSYAISFYQGQTEKYLELAEKLGLSKVNTNNDISSSLSKIFDLLYLKQNLRSAIKKKALHNKTYPDAILSKIDGHFSASFSPSFELRVSTYRNTMSFLEELFSELGIIDYAIFKDYGNYQWIGNDVDVIITEADFDKLHNYLESAGSRVLGNEISWTRSKSHSKSIDLKAEGMLNIDIHTAIGWRGIDVLKFADLQYQIAQKTKFGIDYPTISNDLDALVYAYSHVLEKGFLVGLEFKFLKNSLARFESLGLDYSAIRPYLDWVTNLPSTVSFPLFIPISIIHAAMKNAAKNRIDIRMRKSIAKILLMQIYWRTRFRLKQKLPFGISQYADN
jgi:thymidylate kinase